MQRDNICMHLDKHFSPEYVATLSKLQEKFAEKLSKKYKLTPKQLDIYKKREFYHINEYFY